jgi:hypothetical protein
MHLEMTAGNAEFARAIASLGLFTQNSHGTANALNRFLRMQRLLKNDRESTQQARRQLRRSYLAEVKTFEDQIREIRRLKRMEMARSKHWDFPSYLKGAWTILVCRTSFRAAYIGHLLGMQGTSRWVERAGYRAFNAIFFDLGGLAEFA